LEDKFIPTTDLQNLVREINKTTKLNIINKKL
jgi:hypothetical protein